VELDAPERVLRAGRLPEPDRADDRDARAARVVRGAARGRELDAAAHGDSFAREERSVRARLRQQLLLCDLRRDVPRRIEDELGQVGAELGRLPRLLADDDRHLDLDARPIPQLQLLVRNVDLDVALAEVLGQPARPLERDLELADAFVDRDVERGPGPLADDAVRTQAVARLEALDRLHELRVVDVRLLRPRGDVAARHEAGAERTHGRVDRAGRQLPEDARRGPAALRRD